MNVEAESQLTMKLVWLIIARAAGNGINRSIWVLGRGICRRKRERGEVDVGFPLVKSLV